MYFQEHDRGFAFAQGCFALNDILEVLQWLRMVSVMCSSPHKYRFDGHDLLHILQV
jgi:hypothetical protein